MSRMMLSRKLASLHDVVFLVDSERFPAHRVVVAASSPVFEAMLTNGMRETSQQEITLEGVSAVPWRRTLDFIYRGVIHIRDENEALEVLEIAHKYALTRLLNFIELYLRERLNIDNVCDRLVLADKFDLIELRFETRQRMEEEFSEVCRRESFANIPYEILDELLRSGELVVSSEMTVFHAICGWATGRSGPSDPLGLSGTATDKDKRVLAERKPYADDLMLQHINLSALSPCELRALQAYISKGVCVALKDGLLEELLSRNERMSVSICHGIVLNSRRTLGKFRRNTMKLSFSHLLFLTSDDAQELKYSGFLYSPWHADGTKQRLWRLRYQFHIDGPTLGVKLIMRTIDEREEGFAMVRFQLGIYNSERQCEYQKNAEMDFYHEPGKVAMCGWSEFIAWKEVKKSYMTKSPESLLFGVNLYLVDSKTPDETSANAKNITNYTSSSQKNQANFTFSKDGEDDEDI